MTGREGRTDVAREQRELVEALVGGEPPPPGFDPERVATAAASLRRKRAREAAEAWPHVARCLGPDFALRFTEWARDHAVPAGSTGPWADGFVFVVRAVGRHELDGPAEAERQRGRLRAVVVGGRRRRAASVRRRRAPAVLVGSARGERGRTGLVVTLGTRGRARTWGIPRA